MNTRQIVGLVAVAVFGGILVWTLLKPKPDPFRVPGAMPLAEVPAPLQPIPVPPSPVPPTDAASDPLAVGSEDARDDLYCSGLIYAAHRASGDVVSPEAQTRRDHVIRLAEVGVDKLIAAGAATSDQTGAIADAHTAKAQADFAAGTPRIGLDVCQARAAALPAKQN